MNDWRATEPKFHPALLHVAVPVEWPSKDVLAQHTGAWARAQIQHPRRVNAEYFGW